MNNSTIGSLSSVVDQVTTTIGEGSGGIDRIAERMFDMGMKGMNKANALSVAFKILHLICSYYIPNTASVLWWSFGIWSLLFGNLYLQYLYVTFFFVDTYIASAIEYILRNDLPLTCTNLAKCYCLDAHSFASWFWTLLAHVAEYGPWPPPRWPTFICSLSFFVFVASQCVTGSCTVTGAIFAAIVGATTGVLKVQFYKAAIYPLCRAIIAEKTKVS